MTAKTITKNNVINITFCFGRGESTEVKEQHVRLDDVHHRHRKGNSRNRRHSEGLFTIVQVLYFDREATRKAKLAL